jgi:aryl-alcohol dehydrogenase-like predicted oxidoreductase
LSSLLLETFESPAWPVYDGVLDREATVHQRQLGRSDISVSAIGLGCLGMSGFYGPADHAEAEATLNHALDIGINFLDTADIYGDGHNEMLISRVLAGRRLEMVLATKTGFVKTMCSDGTTTLGVDARPARIRSACDASLARLQTEVIDLYYLHRADPTVPIEDSVGALADLVALGKVRAIGLSEVSAETLRRAHAVHPVAAVQSEYSLWTRDVETSVLPACRELGVAFVPFSPLGRGFLTATLPTRQAIVADDWRANNPRFSADNWDQNTALVSVLTDVANRRQCTPAQVALAWVLSRGPDVIPIPGTKRRRYLDENLGAAQITLEGDELARLETAFPPGAAAGDRYTREQARWSNL